MTIVSARHGSATGTRRSWLRRKRTLFGGAALALALFYFAGFLLFVARVDGQPVPALSRVDAIVVLTGGKNRISQSLELLRERQGQRLLISGVHRDTSIESIMALEPAQKDLLSCCVDLGREATSTVGNAWETRQWVEDGGYRSILLVTSSYHMPRSLMEISRVLPQTTIHAYPIAHDDMVVSEWWRDADMAYLLFREYSKFLVSAVRSHIYPEVEGMSTARISPLKAGI